MSNWVLMNGSSGCLPDNREVFDTMTEAVDGALLLFDDLPYDEVCEMEENLQDSGIHHFNDNTSAGADYVEIVKADEGEIDE